VAGLDLHDRGALNLSRVRNDSRSHFGELDLAGRPQEQRRSQFAFEAADLLAERPDRDVLLPPPE